VTHLQVTACVFGCNDAFNLIEENLTVSPFSGGFFARLRPNALLLQGFEVAHPMFPIFSNTTYSIVGHVQCACAVNVTYIVS